MEEMGMETLSRDIIIDILSRLPAASLVSNFMFVCKDWSSLIQDPDFVKIHLNRVSINGEKRCIIRKLKFGKILFQLNPCLNFDKPPFYFGDLPIAKAKRLDFNLSCCPELQFDQFTRLVGSCNGLLCLSFNSDRIIVLLNLATKKFKISPDEPFGRANEKCVTYGFGYYNATTTIDEYKVLRIARFNPYNVQTPVLTNVYSLSTNSWKGVSGIPCEISHARAGIFLNGSAHWMGCNSRYSSLWDRIVSFNIRDEEFGQVPMSNSVDVKVGNKDDVILMNVRGYLGIVYFSRTLRMRLDLEIWVMKEYGIGESWTKEFVIRTLDLNLNPRTNLPVGFFVSARHTMTFLWTTDQILIQRYYILEMHGVDIQCKRLQRYGRFILYDMNKKKINEDVIMRDIPYTQWDEQADYIGTLVSLESPVLPLNNN